MNKEYKKFKDMGEDTHIPSDDCYGMNEVEAPKKFKAYKVEKDGDTNNSVVIE